MLPVFFGDPAESLYGVYHPPDRPTAKPAGVVLCQPAFHESVNSHRAMRALAEQFGRAGVHTLRFDYRGTGDSAGESGDWDVERCTADIGTAMDEIKASRGLTSVGLVGLRLGASLAARTAARRGGVPFVVLWEPIVEGGSYLQELRDLQKRWVDFEVELRPGARKLATEREVLGHPLSENLAASLSSVDLRTGPGRVADRILIVDEGACSHIDELEQSLAKAGPRVERRRVEGGRIWNRETDGDQARVPRAVLEEIVDWVAREARP